MRKILVLVFCLFIVGACSRDNYRAVMNIENSTSDSWSLNYKFLDGTQTKQILVKEAGVFKIDIVSEEGELDFKINSDDGTKIYVGTNVPTSSFQVIVDNGGTYTLTVEAHNHKGSLSVELVEGEGSSQ